MKVFIIATGLLSSGVGVALQFSEISAFVLRGAGLGILPLVFGLVAILLGVMLILCSRDLKHRGSLVVWEGVLRVVGGALIAKYGIWVPLEWRLRWPDSET